MSFSVLLRAGIFPAHCSRVPLGGSVVYGAYTQSARRLLNDLSRQKGCKKLSNEGRMGDYNPIITHIPHAFIIFNTKFKL